MEKNIKKELEELAKILAEMPEEGGVEKAFLLGITEGLNLSKKLNLS